MHPCRQADDEVQALVQDPRNRPRWVERRWTQDGHDLGLEVLLEPLSLRGDQSSRRTKRMPSSRSAGMSSSLSTRYCSVTSRAVCSATVRNTSAAVRLSGPAGRGADREPMLEAGDADLEELVEVRRGDAEELQRSSRGNCVPSLAADAHVERELRELAIDVVVGQFEVQRVHGHARRCYEMFTAADPSIRRRIRRNGGRPSHRGTLPGRLRRAVNSRR